MSGRPGAVKIRRDLRGPNRNRRIDAESSTRDSNQASNNHVQLTTESSFQRDWGDESGVPASYPELISATTLLERLRVVSLTQK